MQNKQLTFWPTLYFRLLSRLIIFHIELYLSGIVCLIV